MLAVKAKLEQTFYQPLDDMLLHFHVDMTAHHGMETDISGVMGKDSGNGFRVTLARLDNGFLGEKLAHGIAPPFLSVNAARQAGFAALLCCVSVRISFRFPFAFPAGRNTEKSLPAHAPTEAAGRRQEWDCSTGQSDRRQ